MKCPDELETILLDIISMAFLRIRAEAGNGNAERCGIEAYHVHNLPSLLQNYSEAMLMHYYQIEIRNFVTVSDGINIKSFQPLWSKLGRYIELKRLAPGPHSAGPQKK